MRGVAISLEPWPSVSQEGAALSETHFDEVDGGVEPRRPWKPDMNIMDKVANCGALQIITARKDGDLLGYYTWTVQPDPESEGLIYADQGAWFLKRGYAKVAQAMWNRSVEELKRLGVDYIMPHHRLQGRGANLGRFFKRQGAVHVKEVYQMWIGA